MLPLQGIRILDLTRLLPGPLCSLMLADLGAEVLKLEAPQGGDYARWFPPLREQMSAAFAALNRNKRSLSLDLKHPSAVEACLRLVEQVDIVIEGFRAGVMERLGLSYETLKARNSGVIMCSISGYGQDGPMAQRAGHDLNYLARSGLLSLFGAHTNEAPSMPGVQIGDIAGGSYQAVSSILAALFRRERTGEGAHCDVSMTEGLLPFLSMEFGNLNASEEVPIRGDDNILRGGIPCYGIYQCGDGKALSVGSLEPKFWIQFINVLGLPALASEQMETGAGKERVRAQVEAVLAQKTRDEWLEIFATIDACVEPVLTLDELAEDAHFVERGAFQTHEHPTEGSFVLPRSPFRMTDAEPPAHVGAPGLGEHTVDILKECGFDDEEIESLRQQGCIL